MIRAISKVASHTDLRTEISRIDPEHCPGHENNQGQVQEDLEPIVVRESRGSHAMIGARHVPILGGERLAANLGTEVLLSTPMV